MMRWIVDTCLKARVVVIVLAAAMMFFGGRSLRDAPVDTAPVTALQLAGKDVVFYELLSMGYFVVRSADVRTLVAKLREGRTGGR